MYSYQALFGLGDPTWLDPAIAGSIFLISIIVALVFNRLLFPLLIRLTRWTPTDLDTRIVRATCLPLTLGMVVLGGYLALTIPLDLSAGEQDDVNRGGVLLAVLAGVIGVASIASNVFNWHIERASSTDRYSLVLRLFPLLRRIVAVSIYVVGALLVLGQLDINISPLIAGLGLGGLAVALAIQPTLANLFAGTYVMTEGVITLGDYIELENGVSGYVVDVGWRSTRIRTWSNNLVVISNSRFAETIITNYQEPVPAVNVIVNCGVSYDSDLYKVEQVCQEVMEEVRSTNPNAVKEYDGWFGFDSFGDSNVNFWLFVQAKDRIAGFSVQTALMQRLHQRLKEEEIVINYPVRTLQFPKEWGPETLMDRSGAAEAQPPNEGSEGPTGRRRNLQCMNNVSSGKQQGATESGEGAEPG